MRTVRPPPRRCLAPTVQPQSPVRLFKIHLEYPRLLALFCACGVGRFSLTRLSGIVEQIAKLREAGVEVILVSSGAVGCGRRVLSKQALLSSNFHSQLRASSSGDNVSLLNDRTQGYNSACASAGQLGLMSLYETLFGQCEIAVSQVIPLSQTEPNPIPTQ